MAIYKEALNNAARHAEAKRIEIAISASARRVEFEIRDDGKGFDADRVNGGQGLRNLRNRTETLGGRIEIRSRRGAGRRSGSLRKLMMSRRFGTCAMR